MYDDKICTPFELKQFAYTDNTDAYTFARWIESKSSGRYTIVEKKMIEDTVHVLNHYITFASDINDTFKRKWQNTLKALEL